VSKKKTKNKNKNPLDVLEKSDKNRTAHWIVEINYVKRTSLHPKEVTCGVIVLVMTSLIDYTSVSVNHVMCCWEQNDWHWRGERERNKQKSFDYLQIIALLATSVHETKTNYTANFKHFKNSTVLLKSKKKNYPEWFHLWGDQYLALFNVYVFNAI